jgi:hypothetical protein
MQISIDYVPTNYGIEFVNYGNGLRMWLFDKDSHWFPTIGRYCPHKHLGYNECSDCGLVLEGDED